MPPEVDSKVAGMPAVLAPGQPVPESEIPPGMRPAAEFVSEDTLNDFESCPKCSESVIKMFRQDHVCMDQHAKPEANAAMVNALEEEKKGSQRGAREATRQASTNAV